MANKKRHEADDFKTAVKMVQQFVNEIVEKKGLSENTVEEICKGVEQIAKKFEPRDRMKVFNRPKADESNGKGSLTIKFDKSDRGMKVEIDFNGKRGDLINAVAHMLEYNEEFAEMISIALGATLTKNAHNQH